MLDYLFEQIISVLIEGEAGCAPVIIHSAINIVELHLFADLSSQILKQKKCVKFSAWLKSVLIDRHMSNIHLIPSR